MAKWQRKQERQEMFWGPASELPQAPGHPFYERLNKILDGQGFDRFVEERSFSRSCVRLGRLCVATAHSVAEGSSSRDWREWLPLRAVVAFNTAKPQFHHGLLAVSRSIAGD